MALQVLEETGLDITSSLRDQDYIDAQLGDQDTRLFIVQVGTFVLDVTLLLGWYFSGHNFSSCGHVLPAHLVLFAVK
jgi:hypothetical protein